MRNQSDVSALSASDVIAAAKRLGGLVRRTPVLNSALLDRRLGVAVYCKAEPLQLTGSFKVRGAFNKVLRLSEAERARGVVAFSAGNHAQALAFAGARFGAQVTIFMPSDAPRAKIEKTKGFGAEVRFYDRQSDDRAAMTLAFASSTGAIFIPPYDDPLVMAGGGTAALEMIDELAGQGVQLDHLYVPCGGGGLVAGCATIAAERSPRTQVFSVEPEGFDDTARSIAAGRRVNINGEQTSIADALLTTIPGELTFPINSVRLAGALTVCDAEIAEAVRAAFSDLQLVVEPGGAVGLAAVGRPENSQGVRIVGVILSGGNVDASVFGQLLNDGEVRPSGPSGAPRKVERCQ